ncbi:MAG: (d)CMP kinase [SAR324 cluster bacterium]|nr:(d)CMP kinase [SAR324 cluster bacterium]
MKKVLAIDGVAASGKSSVALKVGSAISFRYINSGAVYRAIAYYGIEKLGSHFPNQMGTIAKYLNDNPQTIQLNWKKNGAFAIYLSGKEISDELHSEFLSGIVSKVAAFKEFRLIVNHYLIKVGNRYDSVIDGRDIGQIVFPDAWAKFFLTADVKIRAQRRAKQLGIELTSPKFNELLDSLKKRDYADKNRKHAPLVKGEDAIPIDTTDTPLDQVVELILSKLPES